MVRNQQHIYHQPCTTLPTAMLPFRFNTGSENRPIGGSVSVGHTGNVEERKQNPLEGIDIQWKARGESTLL
jgi:hypothetical protein